MGGMDVAKNGRADRHGRRRGLDRGADRERRLGHRRHPAGLRSVRDLPPARGRPVAAHKQAVVAELAPHTAEQSWWLGFLDTGAHDTVFRQVPMVRLYWGWQYVLVEAGPDQALAWRTGHMRGRGSEFVPEPGHPHRHVEVDPVYEGAQITTGEAFDAGDAIAQGVDVDVQ